MWKLKNKEDKKLDRTPYIFLALLFVFVSQLSQGNNPNPLYSSDEYNVYHTAESLYTIGNFYAALHSFENFSDLKLLNRNPEAQFKMAYSYFQTGNYDSSASIFYKLYQEHHYIEKYSRYFYIKSQWKLNPSKGISEAINFVSTYKNHALADSFLIPIADAYFEMGNFKEARKIYKKAQRRKISREKSVYARIQAAYCLYYTVSKKQAFNEFYQIIRKYPGEGETILLAENLRKDEP